jgi:hypothetical protein
MTKQNFDVNRLRIASPCSVDWETMSGDERMRHCQLCRLNVYNISEMTEPEVRALFTESEGRVCARLYKRADGTVITKDCPVGFRAYQKRAARAAGAALAAILGLFSVSFGQQESEKSIDASKANIVRTSRAVNQKNILTGTITDRTGAAAHSVTVTIFRSGDGEKLQVYPNAQGYYQSPELAAGIYTLEVGDAGNRLYQVTGIKVNNNEQVNLDIRLDIEFGYSLSGFVEQMPLPTQRSGELLKLQPQVTLKKSKKSKKPR